MNRDELALINRLTITAASHANIDQHDNFTRVFSRRYRGQRTNQIAGLVTVPSWEKNVAYVISTILVTVIVKFYLEKGTKPHSEQLIIFLVFDSRIEKQIALFFLCEALNYYSMVIRSSAL